MLKLRIAAVGRDRGTATADLTEAYLARAQDIARAQGFFGPDLSIVDAPRGLEGPIRQRREADLLFEACLPGGDVVVLDERGKGLSSEAFATLLAERRDAGVPAITFLIGGADGHPPELVGRLAPRPVRKISFGTATWPHLLVRVMMAEQIYRAFSILAGHPYHRR